MTAAAVSGHRTGIRRPTRLPALVVSSAILGAVAVISLGFAMKAVPGDMTLVVALNQLHTGGWGMFADMVYRVIQPIPAVMITLVIAAIVWAVARSLRTALLFGITAASAWLPVAAIKVLVDRPRPDAALLPHPFSPLQTDGSFPSGHTAYVVALAVTFWFLLRDTRYSWAPVLLGAIGVVVIGAAVVSDGLHFPTDVLGSIVWVLSTAPAVRWVVVDLLAVRVVQVQRC